MLSRLSTEKTETPYFLARYDAIIRKHITDDYICYFVSMKILVYTAVYIGRNRGLGKVPNIGQGLDPCTTLCCASAIHNTRAVGAGRGS